ncbi:MAG: hypothetical protein HON21_16765 [Gammaproteobacteria bacterium]|nr:hypothetical protein [Gammaproteobacteria bacterium]
MAGHHTDVEAFQALICPAGNVPFSLGDDDVVGLARPGGNRDAHADGMRGLKGNPINRFHVACGGMPRHYISTCFT